MTTTIKDDRTDAQKRQLDWLIVGTDPSLGSWGGRCGVIDGQSYAAWACCADDLRDVECYVERRGDMKRVRRVYAPDYRPRNAHLHIYVADRYQGARFAAERGFI